MRLYCTAVYMTKFCGKFTVCDEKMVFALCNKTIILSVGISFQQHQSSSLSLSISVPHFNLQFFSEICVTLLTMDSIHFIDVHKHMYIVDILVIMVLKYNDSTWSEIELCETTRKLSIFYRIANSIFNQCLHEHFTKCMLSTTKHVYRVS